jgi:hypothetical protein
VDAPLPSIEAAGLPDSCALILDDREGRQTSRLLLYRALRDLSDGNTTNGISTDDGDGEKSKNHEIALLMYIIIRSPSRIGVIDVA